MASAQSVPYMSIEEYLKSVFRPDVDYVDGYIEERNSGEFDHGNLQGTLYGFFHERRREWNVRVALDTRMQVAARRLTSEHAAGELAIEGTPIRVDVASIFRALDED